MLLRTAALTALLLSTVRPMSAQTVSTIATGFRGDALLVEPSGDVLVSDFLGGSDRPDRPRGSSVRRITPTGHVSTLIDGLAAPTGLARDADGNIYVATASRAQLDTGIIMRRAPDGRTVRFADGMRGLAALAFLPNGDLLAAGTSAGVIYRVTRSGAVTDFIRDARLRTVTGLAVSGDTVFASTFAAGTLYRVIADRSLEPVARLTDALGLAPVNYIALREGVVYANIGSQVLSKSDGHRVVRVTMDGRVAIVAGNGEGGSRDGVASDARFLHNAGIGVSPDGAALYVADWNGLRMIRLR